MSEGEDEDFNFENAGSWNVDDEYVDTDGKFKIADIEVSDGTHLKIVVDYIRWRVGIIGIRVIKHRTVKNLYKNHIDLGFFHIYMHRSFFYCVR